MANSDVKVAAQAAGIKLWQIANELSITDSTFSRRLRYELSIEEKAKIYSIIEKLKVSE